MNKIVYTEEIVEEIYKCSQDILYFAELIGCQLTYEGSTLLKIISENQKINLINPNREFLIPYILHYMIFQDCKRISIVTERYKELMREILEIYEKMPLWMQRGIMQCNKTKFQLENSTQLKVMNLSMSNLRLKGCSQSILIVDDVDTYSVKNWSVFYELIYPTVASSKVCKIILAAYKSNSISETFKENIFTVENIS